VTKSNDKCDGDLERALAVLIACTRSKKRPLPLTEVSKSLRVALSRLGSYGEVADRVGLSPKMLRQFAYVDRLATAVRAMVESRRLDSVDAVAHLAMLPATEQCFVADAFVSEEIDTADIRAIVRLRRVGQHGSIGKLLTQVKESKTKKEYVAEFVVRGAPRRGPLLNALERYIPPREIVRLELHGVLARLVLTRKGKQALLEASKRLGVPLARAVPTILQGECHS
jgi:hypothetical protein